MFDQWGAIGWVFGGVAALSTFYVLITNVIEKRDKKRDAMLSKKWTTDQSLKANWERTDSMEVKINQLTELSSTNHALLKEVVEQRKSALPYQLEQASALETLLDHHKSELPKIDQHLSQLHAEKNKLMVISRTRTTED